MADFYEDRMLRNGAKKEKRDWGVCPDCGHPRYYAESLQTHRGTQKNVVYCGRCVRTWKPEELETPKEISES